MATVHQFRERLEPLANKEFLYSLFLGVVSGLQEYLLDFNKIRLEVGQDIFGRTIGTYSKATELESLFGQGPRPIKPKVEGQPYNFQWTGGLFDGMYIEFSKDSFTFTSKDQKTPELVAKYGDIFGLQEKDLQEALDNKIYPGFMELIRKQLLLTL